MKTRTTDQSGASTAPRGHGRRSAQPIARGPERAILVGAVRHGAGALSGEDSLAELERLAGLFPLASMVAIVSIIAIIVSLNRETLEATAPLVALAVVLHNGLGLAAGYGLGRAPARLARRQGLLQRVPRGTVDRDHRLTVRPAVRRVRGPARRRSGPRGRPAPDGTHAAPRPSHRDRPASGC